MTSYEWLKAHFEKIGVLCEIGAVLEWDSSVMMPPAGAKARADHAAAIADMVHALLIDKHIEPAIRMATDRAILGQWDSRNLELMTEAYRAAVTMPAQLVTDHARLSSTCMHEWEAARATNDFASVAPTLAKLVAVTREMATRNGDEFGLSPYDALLDDHTPGLRHADIEPLFAEYRAALPFLLIGSAQKQRGQPAPIAWSGVEPARQEAFCRQIAAKLGFRSDSFRLDESEHPFMTGHRGDHRVTATYTENALDSVYSTLHECGHATYERGLPEKWDRQPVGGSLGMGVHESQSIFFERHIGENLGFLEWIADMAPLDLPAGAHMPENILRLRQQVQPSFIRIDADAVTYPAHVILRDRLERALLSGELDVAGLPTAWNEGMRDLLGITPPTDTLGCLQDIHWYAGMFGYFPSYFVGAALAAQLAGMIEGKWSIADGDTTYLQYVLQRRVHQWGSVLKFDELVWSSTGNVFGVEAFLRHLEAIYC